MLGLAGQSADGSDCFIGGPYVLHVEHDRAQIVWVTPAGTDAGSVAIEANGGEEQQNVKAVVSIPLFRDRNSEEDELDHLRHLSKVEELQPHTEYHYEVQCGDGESTASGRFKTPPKPGESVPVEFVAVGDGHANTINSSYIRISEPVGEIKPDFVIHAGDLRGGRGHDWSRWEGYLKVARPYLQNSIFLPVVGAHDVRPARNFRSLFAFNDPDGNPDDEDDAGTYYTMQYGNILVIILDHVYEIEEQVQWVEEVLSQSEAEWIIVSSHESWTSVASRGNWLRNEYYKDFSRIFEEHGVDIVITAHDHMYERRIPFGSKGVKPVHYITINSNGNSRSVRPSPVVAGGIGKREHVYTHFRVDGNQLEMDVIKYDGTVLDRLELIKDDDGMYQDEVMEQAVDLDLAHKLSHIYTGQSMTEGLRYERRDIMGQFKSQAPENGESVVLKLNTGNASDHERDVSRFPLGSKLIVYEQNDPSSWQTEKQIIEITGDTTEIEVTAPDNMIHDVEGFDPPLELEVNIRVDGRDFERATIRPTLTGSGELDKVNLEAPSSNQWVPAKPVFAWEEMPQAREYQLQAGLPDFDNVKIDTIVTDTHFKYSNGLEEGEDYVWRVRALNEFEGPWSDEIRFHVNRSTEQGNFDPVSFGDNLVPAVDKIEVPSVNFGSTGRFRGENSMFTWLEADGVLPLKVRGGGISHFQDRGNVRINLIKVANADTVDRDHSVPPDGEFYEVELVSPSNGLHELQWNDGNDRTALEWPEGQPMSIRASKEHPFSFQRGFHLYFYVPEGTSVVAGHLSSHSSVDFYDGSGNEFTGWQNTEDGEGSFVIPVPEGLDNTFWSVEGERNRTLSLYTVPPYLARSTEELLLPEELFETEDIPTSSRNDETPSRIELEQNYPNPFNPETIISFSLPEQEHVTLEVYNVAGQRVMTLLNEVKPSGSHEVVFDASDLSSGVYLYRLQTNDYVKSRQMLLIK
ncbi:metallophosphoesterase [Natronogracilivirga saccharolytica]|uniref:T9SS type A sorting domain-containing protein n=1 Tax=Natronogracilivirga saccharolytica TaxID=2812953 RepID=A0A8J7RTX9_9BACT|nr:metallophosphoesterase [Natronogracilivirga saccharolytica]MBP3193844.1 T9SS type A sorting domain-containing protein [Natronogracilivirga saccharolytica]